MSERATVQTETVSNYERVHGVPENVSEGVQWARQGYVTVDILREFAEGMCVPHPADIARYALRAVVRDQEYLKLLHERTHEKVAQRNLTTNQQLMAHAAIEQLQTPHHTVEVAVMHRPAEVGGEVQTRAQFFDQGGSKDLLDHMDEWMVPLDAIQRIYPKLDDENVRGSFMNSEGELVRPALHRYGDNEKKVIEAAALLLRAA